MPALDSIAAATVVVYEQDKRLQKAIRRALPKVKVVFVGHSSNALEIMNQQQPDVILVDVRMPSLDGFEMLRELRVREWAQDVPVLMLSAAGPSEPARPTEGLITGENLDTLQSRIDALLAERAMRRAFREVYSSVLLDAAHGARSLTPEERRALIDAGFPVDGEVETGPVAERMARYQRLFETSLTTEQAAKKLGVNASRVRQRLLADPPDLYGIRRNNVWRLPSFQFASKGLVPNIEKVIAVLDSKLDPVAVERWFLTRTSTSSKETTGSLRSIGLRKAAIPRSLQTLPKISEGSRYSCGETSGSTATFQRSRRFPPL